MSRKVAIQLHTSSGQPEMVSVSLALEAICSKEKG